jgi:hypothetical protein
MAKRKKSGRPIDGANAGQDRAADASQPGKESTAGYFRRVFQENPQLLNERSNRALLQRWLADHPGEKVSGSVKAGLSNIKSVLRSRGRKTAARKGSTDPRGPGSGERPGGQRPHHRQRGLAPLEEAIDECLMLARATDREGLEVVIDLLRRARNQVVWKMGQPE